MSDANKNIDALIKGTSLWRDAWRRLIKNRAAMTGGVIVLIMMSACLTAPLWVSSLWTSFEFDEQHRVSGIRPPGARSIPMVHVDFYDASEQGFGDADTNNDGEVTPKELSELLARIEFIRFDTNQDFVLDAHEVDDAPISKIDLDNGEPPVLVTMRAAYTTYLQDNYDRFDVNKNHQLEADEFANAGMAALKGQVGERFGEFVEWVEEKETLPVQRNDVRIISRAMTQKWCATLDDCTVEYEQSHLFTNIFPVGEATRFVLEHDTDKNGSLSEAEFPGVPEPETHLLGTDEQGRDLLTRILHGGQISFMVGLLATLVSLIIGVTWGSIAGYVGGRLDNAMMRVVDVLYGLPFMFLVILLMVIVGNDIRLLFIALGAVQWLTMSRIVRGQVITLKNREFVEAARSIGVSGPAIVFKHLIPNALGPIIVYSTLLVPAVMLEEAFLSFLGLGVRAPMASWGTLAHEGANAIQSHPWLILYPGLALAITLLSLNFLGDGLRDALDPHMKK